MRNSVKAETKAQEETTSDTGGAAQHSPQPSLPSPYEAGERVIASHGQHFYEAIVEKVEFREGWMFFVHYWRWSRSWDEWVREDLLMKFTEENSQRMSYAKKHVTVLKAGAAGRLSSTQSDSRGKRHKNDSAFKTHKRKSEQTTVKGTHNKPVEKLVNISVPPTLKKQLMDDFELIKNKGKLVKLPRTPNADDIIKKYQEYRRKKDAAISTSVGEVLSGLCAYFNKALPVMLLYDNERLQYQEAINENVSPSAVYGAEHLLRLFVKLPALLYDLNIDQETLQDLQKNLHDFLKFLRKNQSVFFLSMYNVPEHS